MSVCVCGSGAYVGYLTFQKNFLVKIPTVGLEKLGKSK